MVRGRTTTTLYIYFLAPHKSRNESEMAAAKVSRSSFDWIRKILVMGPHKCSCSGTTLSANHVAATPNTSRRERWMTTKLINSKYVNKWHPTNHVLEIRTHEITFPRVGPRQITHDPTVFNIHIIGFNFKILDICFKMGGSDFQDHQQPILIV